MGTLQPIVGGHPVPPRTADLSFKDVLTNQAASPSSDLFFSPSVLDPQFAPSTGKHKGMPAIAFKKSHVSKLSHTFQWALIGKFSKGYNKEQPHLGRPSVETLQKYFDALDFRGSFQLGLMDNRHLLIQFHLQEDFMRMYSKPVWYVKGIPMRIFKWSNSFHVDKEPPLAPVWISLPRLPVHFFDRSALFAIVSLIGTPLRMDSATASLKRPSIARVQLELDLLKERPNRVWISTEGEEGFWQKIEYEGIPDYCQHCWHIGHSDLACHIHNPELKVLSVPPKPPKTQYVPISQPATASTQPSVTAPVPPATVRHLAVDVMVPAAALPNVDIPGPSTVSVLSTFVPPTKAPDLGDDACSEHTIVSLQPLDADSLLVAEEIGFPQQPVEVSPAPVAKPSLVFERDDASRATLEVLETAADNNCVVVATRDNVVVSIDEHSNPSPINALVVASNAVGVDSIALPVDHVEHLSIYTSAKTHKTSATDSANDLGAADNVVTSTQLVCGTDLHGQSHPLAILNPYAAAFHLPTTASQHQCPKFPPLLPQTRVKTSMGNDEDYTDNYGSDELEEDEDRWSPTYEDMTDGSEGSLLLKRNAKKKNKINTANHLATTEDFYEESRRLGLRLKKKGRPPGSRNRTYFGIRTMETRASKSTSN